jgi:hypothetical protein
VRQTTERQDDEEGNERTTFMVNIRSAQPYPASAVRVRLVAKVAEFPMERTETRITAWNIEGRAIRVSKKFLACELLFTYTKRKRGNIMPLIVCLIGITKGDVVDPLLFKRLGSLLYNSKKPIRSEMT